MDVSKDVLLRLLREKKATCVPIPAKLNRNKVEIPAKAIFVEPENKFAPFMKKLVYIRYEKKYRKWTERLGVSVSEEELKKGIEEDGADGYDAEVPDEE